MSSHLMYWLAALHISGIGPRRWLQWLKQFENITAIFKAEHAELRAKGLSEKYINAIKTPDWQAIEKDLVWSEKADQHIITLDDANYPSLLKEISDPPILLYLRGNPLACQHQQLAIVGSRHATHWGLKNAEQFAYALAERGIAITSGFALGVDGASHKGALNAKGITIGVSGTGLQQIYPTSHRKLVDQIVQQQGAVISEFPLFAPALATNFPRRNRIIAGMSMGVLVVEAALKSGSLITAHFALEAGREVFAIPGSIHHPLSKGCHQLIRQGAKLVETATDILEELEGCYPLQQPKNETALVKPQITPEQELLFNNIGYETTPVDMIISRSGLTASQVSSILLTLELAGLIRSIPGGYVRQDYSW